MKVLFRETDQSLIGNGSIVFDWRPGGNHIAVGGNNGVVCLYDRYGERTEEVRGGSKIDLLRWDSEGEILAIASGQSSAVQLYELATRQIITLDISMGTKGLPTFMQWSKKHQVLIIGTNQGSILIYNHYSSKKLPLVGKHQRAIITGDFDEDIFALGSDDLSITVNNLEGETLSTISCTAEPTNLKISKFRRVDAERDKEELFISYIVGHRTLSIVTANDTSSPISLQFQDKYGQIVDTSWHNNGMIMIAFEMGFLVVLSAQDWNDVNHELFSVQEFTSTITCLYTSLSCERLFSGADNGQGLQIASQLADRQIKRECGIILEQMRLYSDAAQIFEVGKYYDRAAVAYIKSKNWMRILPIEEHVKSPKVLTQYGKLLLADKKYERAYQVFQRARSHDNVVMVLLKHMNRVDEAVEIARESRSLDGLKMIAKFFTDVGNDDSAIEFLVLSQCFQEAYNLALSTKKMEVYASAVEDHGSTQQFLQLADYYNAVNKNAEAGRFYGLAKEYESAINHLIKAGDNEEAIMDAVDFTAQSNNSILVEKVVHYLMGEPEGVPKDPKFLFHLYTKLGMHSKAAKIALIIAMDQQNRGSYKSAHKLLFTMRQQLKDQKIYIPMELEDWLFILHSYILAKRHVAAGNHLNAGRLLVRVARNVSRFVQHEVQILTSTVITCAKANLRGTAYELATRLIKPGMREKLDKKYKRTIETIVRKAENVADPPEIMTSCPFCGHSVREFETLCDGCKNTLPYCIVTGKHVIDSDFSLCSSCKMPAFCSELQKLERSGEPCPMCQSSVGSPAPINIKLYLNMEGNNKQTT
uniref:Intraflagellar transport protein 122 homolog n=1 Tax=Bursaphelenchus xylophilus TaxID=6326 RepID=A0A1I7STJ9_BURXY